MDSGIMGFCGFGLMFNDSTTLRIRLCVFRDSAEPFTCQPVRTFAWSWSWASESLTAPTSLVSGVVVARSVVPLPLDLLRLLRLLWNLYRSLATLLGIITRQAREDQVDTRKKKKRQENRCRILLASCVCRAGNYWLLKWRWNLYPVYHSRLALEMKFVGFISSDYI